MSGLEIYGALAATASLVKVCIAVRDHYKRNSRTWESLDKAGRSFQLQHDALRSSLKAIDVNFKKYKRDLEPTLSRKDREEFSKLIDDVDQLRDECEATAKRMKAALKKDPIDCDKLNELRRELETAVSGVERLHSAFATHVSLESCRLSLTTSNIAGPIDTISINSVDSGPPRPARQNTWASDLTAVSPPSTSRTSVGSAASTESLKFFKSKRLEEAVETGDLNTLEDILEAGGSEIESRKATALFFACRHKKTSLARYLLSINASIHIHNDTGLGIVHRTIGTSPTLQRSKAILDILELLVEHKASLSAPDKSSLRRTPLHYCADTGNIEAAEYILGIKPNVVDQVDAKRKTALYLACEDHSPKPKLIELLLEYGATFGQRHRPKIESRDKRDKIRHMLDKAESKRPLTAE